MKMDTLTSETASCAFYVSRKGRYCKMSAVPGKTFCSQHLPINNVSDARPRVVCPLDSKHSCYKDELQRHLKKCNAREKLQPIYYEKNINSGDEKRESKTETIPLNEIPDEVLLKVLSKLEETYNDQVSLFHNHTRHSDIMTEELNNPSYGPYVLKHLKQNAALLGILKENNLLQDGNCFIEFGAGRGQLSHWIIQTLKPSENSSFVLIERGSQRHKFDNRYKTEGSPKITRLKIDIEHLNLSKIPALAPNSTIVAVGKHLCGAATDLALQCLMNYKKNNDHNLLHSVTGICIALCCHHQCNWNHYVGKKYLQSWGFHEQHFNILRSLSSWATCGTLSQPHSDGASLAEISNQRYKRLALSVPMREDFGSKSKLLLDEGRMRFLREHGFDVKLITYVQKDVSLENVALIATLT